MSRSCTFLLSRIRRPRRRRPKQEAGQGPDETGQGPKKGLGGAEKPYNDTHKSRRSGLPKSQKSEELGRAKKSQILPLAKDPLGPHTSANDKCPLPKAEGEQFSARGNPAPSKLYGAFLLPETMGSGCQAPKGVCQADLGTGGDEDGDVAGAGSRSPAPRRRSPKRLRLKWGRPSKGGAGVRRLRFTARAISCRSFQMNQSCHNSPTRFYMYNHSSWAGSHMKVHQHEKPVYNSNDKMMLKPRLCALDSPHHGKVTCNTV